MTTELLVTNLNAIVVGELNEGGDDVDVFGLFDNAQKLENGWLTSDVIVQLRLNSKSIQWISEFLSEREVNY